MPEFLCCYPYIKYFVFLVSFARDNWFKIDKKLLDSLVSTASTKGFRDLIEDNIDVLLYLEDMASVGNPKLEQILVNALLAYAILPALFGSFTFTKKGSLSINFAIFLLYQLFRYFRHQRMHDVLGMCLFSPTIDSGLLGYITSPPADPFDYAPIWNNSPVFAKEREFCRVQ